MPHSGEDRATVLARSYIDEEPAPRSRRPVPAGAAAAAEPSLPPIRFRYRITTVAGFGDT